MNYIKLPSPNYNSRNGQRVDMLVLHYTGMKTGAEALARLCDPEAKVSAHYVVEENGDVYQLVEESERAWHAGVSGWRGNSNINQRSIGIEIVNPGHEFGYRAFHEVQMDAVIALCQGILSRHEIPARNVVGHSDVAPARKEDPGELFDWQRLARAGVGLWPSLSFSAREGEKELQAYGYDIEDMQKTITAFQRRYRQTSLTGIWDRECTVLLAGLLRQL